MFGLMARRFTLASTLMVTVGFCAMPARVESARASTLAAAVAVSSRPRRNAWPDDASDCGRADMCDRGGIRTMRAAMGPPIRAASLAVVPPKARNYRFVSTEVWSRGVVRRPRLARSGHAFDPDNKGRHYTARGRRDRQRRERAHARRRRG